MINDPFHPEEAIERQKETSKRTLFAVVCAVGITAILLVGYGYFRKRHALQNLANNKPPATTDNGPKGPPLAHIIIDEPLLEKGTTTIGGAVKNISKQELTGLSIALELRRRKDGGTEQMVIPVAPSELQPDQEGTYSLKLPAQDYASIRLIGIKADPKSTPIAFTSAPGKKRPPERLEPHTIVVRPSKRGGEFINTPDNPTRVP